MMGREEYLRKLMEEIKDFPEEDREQIKEYFEEMICDRMENGETEEEIMQAIGSPEQAGMKLRSEYEARPDHAAEEDRQDEAGDKAQDESREGQRTYREQDIGAQFSEKIMQASETAMQMLEKIIQVPEKILSDIDQKRRAQDTASRYGQRGSAYGRRQDGSSEQDAQNVVYEQDVQTEEYEQDVRTQASEQSVQTEVSEQSMQTEPSEQPVQAEAGEQCVETEDREQDVRPQAGEQSVQTEANEQPVQAEAGEQCVETGARKQDVQTKASEQSVQNMSRGQDVQTETRKQSAETVSREQGVQPESHGQDAPHDGYEQSTQNSQYGQGRPNHREEYSQDASYDELQFIRVQAENTKIHVRTVKRDTVQVLFQPRDGVDEVWTSEEGGGFTFNHRMRKFWFFDVWDFGRNKWITVEIPENYRGRVEMITKNAIIQAENLSGLETLQLETSNARINVARVSAENVCLETSNAPISVSDVTGRELWAKSCNGHIGLDSVRFTNSLDVTTSNASMEVSGVSANSISLQTSNAAVRGWLDGSIADYDIESRTSNASSTLPTNMRMGKGRKLKVRTSNGKINISFAENL